MSFSEFNFEPSINEALEVMGFVDATPIQQQAIPKILNDIDLIACAQTGTGKTAAFLLPILNKLAANPSRPNEINTLVIAPTRELALQIDQQVEGFGYFVGVSSLPVYGGGSSNSWDQQKRALTKGADIIIATPGRFIAHLNMGYVKLDQVKHLVLDEADRMLDMGFQRAIDAITGQLPTSRQTLLFSATYPREIQTMATRVLTNPVMVQVEAPLDDSSIEQHFYQVRSRDHRREALRQVLGHFKPKSALLFCNTKKETQTVADMLVTQGFSALALHGDFDQRTRDRTLTLFANRSICVLVATDVAARGLDVDSLTHVVNYDIPSAPESYVHRIGRVGRAGREGVAITLATPRQKRLLQNIERLTKQTITIHKVPTITDLRERQIEDTIEAVKEALSDGDLDDYQGVFHALKGQDSDRNIALAAIKLVHVARGAVLDEPDIPDASSNFSGNDHGDKKKGRKRDRNERADRQDRGDRGERKQRPVDPNTGFVYIGVGSRGGVRPGDLVGAIANETSLSGRDIGPIKISDHYSVVGVPDASVDEVVGAIKRSTVKGKKAKARRYTD